MHESVVLIASWITEWEVSSREGLSGAGGVGEGAFFIGGRGGASYDG